MDRKEEGEKLMAVEFDGEGGEGKVVMVPRAWEFLLLNQSNKLNMGSGGGGVGDGEGNELADDINNSTVESEALSNREVGYLSKMGNTIAMCDLQGQMAPEFDWYKPDTFVCWHCL